eukprot:1156841-Pelagomonas_calceolata.AAC.3
MEYLQVRACRHAADDNHDFVMCQVHETMFQKNVYERGKRKGKTISPRRTMLATMTKSLEVNDDMERRE